MSSAMATLRVLITLLAFALAQQAPPRTDEYTPKAGQPGKDVIWLPTPEGVVEQMLRMAGVGPEDYVIDLGSGDGRTVVMAAEKFGARGLGIEYNSNLVELSKRNAERAGVSDRVEFVQADFFETDFRQGTVITMYLTTIVNLKLQRKLLALRPGTRIVSYAFRMGAWAPDQTVAFGGRNAYLWIVPAEVAGKWKVTLDGVEETWTLALDQKFQMLSGRVDLPNGSFEMEDGYIEGREIRFHFFDASGDRRDFSGRALAGHLEGTVRREDGRSLRWSAAREDG